MKQKIFALIFVTIFLFSCGEGDSTFLKKDSLFKLYYGKMDDQIDISSGSSLPAVIKMADGIIYIMNSNLKKVMKFTSFGDLLAVIGETGTDGNSIIPNTSPEDEKISNIKAVFFPFNNPEYIAVNNSQQIYVSDLLPAERHEWDDNEKIMLSNIIYRFDSNCNFIDSIGQDGKGGIPFPFIENIQINSNEDIIVTSITPSKKIVYWLNKEGVPLYKIELADTAAPLPNNDNEFQPSIETIRIPKDDFLLYIKTDYYKKTTDASGITQSDIDFYKSYINVLDIRSSSYTEMIEIPKVFTAPDSRNNFLEQRFEILYDFINIIDNKHIFLSSIINNENLQILVLGTNGTVTSQARLKIDFPTSYFIVTDMNSEGILTILNGSNTDASVEWARTDLLLKEIR